MDIGNLKNNFTFYEGYEDESEIVHSAESSGLRCVSERTLCKAQRTP